MSTLSELQVRLLEANAKRDTLRDEVADLAERGNLSLGEEQRFQRQLVAAKRADVEAKAVRSEMAAIIIDTKVGTDSAADFRAANGFNVGRKVDPSAVDRNTASRGELRDAGLAVMETEGRHLADFQKVDLDNMLRGRKLGADGAEIAKLLLLTETNAYRSAFIKGITQQQPMFEPDEIRAINEYRAASETSANGGYGVPVLIDPTIILSSGAISAPILDICRVITITTNAWKGVVAPGATWSYDAEGAEVSDDAPTFTQPDIPVYSARGFIPYSIEVEQDYPGFVEEMAKILSQGYVNLMAVTTMTGSGSSQPTGIFTSMQNTTTAPAHVTSTTAGTLGAVDLRSAYSKLPERFRPGSSWLMSPTVMAQVRALGNNLNIADFTIDFTREGVTLLTGKQVISTDYAPAFSSTTGAASYAIVGDFSNYVVVQRAGMTVELVQHLFGTAANRPTGQRGWFAFARNGADVVNPGAFRLLSNT